MAGKQTPSHDPRKRRAAAWLRIAALVGVVCSSPFAFAATPLASLEYRVTGTGLKVSPVAVSVPKGIAGSVLVSVIAGGSTNSAASRQLSSGAYVEAILRGPAFPEPRRLVGPPNAPLLLPPINLVGDYQLDDIRLVDAATGATRMEGTPSSIPVRVFDEVLVSRVTSRPLTLEEIQDKGIVIDESNFRAVEFEVGFVLDGKTIPVTFPGRVADVHAIPPRSFRRRNWSSVSRRPRRSTSRSRRQIVQLAAGVRDGEPEHPDAGHQLPGGGRQRAGQSLALSIPPIPALMVIPGNIGFLNQFFSVQIFTENGAPVGSGLSVNNIQAQPRLCRPDRTGSSAPITSARR